MNALRAEKSIFSPENVPLRSRSREQALASALETPDQVAIHEQVVDPMVYRAASELIRLDDEGRKTNIEAQGQVYDVLQSIEEGLKNVGASHLATTHILDTLANYVSGLGADFVRQAKAKPLYARVMVTDHEPEDIPECKLSSVTCIDGQRVQGDDAGKMSMTLTLYGTSNAMSQGMSMNRIFESGKKKWLLVYYGTVEGADLHKFDTVDADLATLVQAVGPAGAAAMEDVRKAIEQGTITPELKQLIATIAELNRTIEAARTPGAIENPAAKIAELKAAIVEIAQSVPDMQSLPPVLLQVVAESVSYAAPLPKTPEGPVTVEPSNDNDTVLEQTRSVLEKITVLLQSDALPPEIRETLTAIVEKIDSGVAGKNFANIESAMTKMRETLVEFAASESISPQMFHAVSQVLPAVTVAEKQLGEAVLQVPAGAMPKVETVANEGIQAVADLIALVSEKIEVLLKDDAVPAEVKQRLTEIVKSLESAVEQKDFSKVSVAVTEMRQALGDLAVKENLPPQIARVLQETIPAVTVAEQKMGDIAPRVQAEKIFEAIVQAEQKIQAGEIKIDPSNVALKQVMEIVQETVKQEGPEAAIKKIAEALKAPGPDGGANPVVQAFVKQPEILQALPVDVKNTIIAAIPANDTASRAALAVAGIEVPKPIQPENFIQTIQQFEKQIQDGNKAEPVKAEVAKLLADLKDAAKAENPETAIRNVIEKAKMGGNDPVVRDVIEKIVSEPSIPQQIREAVQPKTDGVVHKDSAVPKQEIISPVRDETQKTATSEKITQAINAIEKQVQDGAKGEPVKSEVIKLLAEIKDAVKTENPEAAIRNAIEKAKVGGNESAVRDMIEKVANEPSMPRQVRDAVVQIQGDVPARHDAVNIVRNEGQKPVTAENIAETVKIVERQIVAGGQEAAKPEIVKFLADLKEAANAQDPAKAIDTALKTFKATGNEAVVGNVVEAISRDPSISPQIREAVIQIQPKADGLASRDSAASAQERVHPARDETSKVIPAEKVTSVIKALETQMQEGPAKNPEIASVLDAVKKAAEKGGPVAAAEVLQEALQRNPANNGQQYVQDLIKQTGLTTTESSARPVADPVPVSDGRKQNSVIPIGENRGTSGIIVDAAVDKGKPVIGGQPSSEGRDRSVVTKEGQPVAKGIVTGTNPADYVTRSTRAGANPVLPENDLITSKQPNPSTSGHAMSTGATGTVTGTAGKGKEKPAADENVSIRHTPGQPVTRSVTIPASSETGTAQKSPTLPPRLTVTASNPETKPSSASGLEGTKLPSSEERLTRSFGGKGTGGTGSVPVIPTPVEQSVTIDYKAKDPQKFEQAMTQFKEESPTLRKLDPNNIRQDDLEQIKRELGTERGKEFHQIANEQVVGRVDPSLLPEHRNENMLGSHAAEDRKDTISFSDSADEKAGNTGKNTCCEVACEKGSVCTKDFTKSVNRVLESIGTGLNVVGITKEEPKAFGVTPGRHI